MNRGPENITDRDLKLLSLKKRTLLQFSSMERSCCKEEQCVLFVLSKWLKLGAKKIQVKLPKEKNS